MTAEKISEFIAITDSDEATAKQYLEMFNNDIQSAVVQYLDHNSDGKAPSSAVIDEDNIRNPIPQIHERLIDEENHDYMFRPMSSRRTFTNPSETIATRNNGDDPINESGRQEESNFYRLFKPPTEILYSGSIESACNEARQRERLLLVSVHDDTCFECHMLNRDVWKEFKIMNLIKKSFIFTQPILGSFDASWYTRKFPYIKESAHFSIIDPVTMQQKAMWTRIVDANMVFEVLKDYVPPGTITVTSERSLSPVKRPISLIDIDSDSDESDFESSSKTNCSKRTRTNSYMTENGKTISKRLSECSIKEDDDESMKNLADLSEEELLRLAIENSKKSFASTSASANGVAPQTCNNDDNNVKFSNYLTLPEPTGDDQVYRLMIRLPCGQRMPLKVASHLPAKSLLLHLEAIGYKSSDYELLRCNPRLVIDDNLLQTPAQSLSSIGLHNGDLLNLQEK